MKGFTLRLFLLLVLIALTVPLQAQVLSTASSAALSANLQESLSVSLTGGTPVDFGNLTALGVTAASTPVSIQTAWVLNPSRGTVRLVGYFDTLNALTDGAGNNIASSNVKGQVTTGTPTSFTAFTQTVSGIGTAGASLELFSEAIGGTNKNKTRTDSLDLEIDLTGTQQPAGTYTGTLRIQAIAL
jgi:hypothetical protein